MGLAVTDGFYVKLPNHIWGRMTDQCRTCLWLYMWLIDKTTEEEEVDGELHGLVLGGTPLSYKDIGKYAGMSWSTVQRQVKALVKGNYIRLYPGGTDGRYRYHVADSYKFNKRLDEKRPALTKSQELQQKLKKGEIVARTPEEQKAFLAEQAAARGKETAAVDGWEAEDTGLRGTTPESNKLAQEFNTLIFGGKGAKHQLRLWSALFADSKLQHIHRRLIKAAQSGGWEKYLQRLDTDPVEFMLKKAGAILSMGFMETAFSEEV